MLNDFFHPKVMLNLKTYVFLDYKYPFHLPLVPGSWSELPATDISLFFDMHTTLEIIFTSYIVHLTFCCLFS